MSINNELWINLTCSACTSIPFEIDFRLRVVREDISFEKRGSQSTEGYFVLLGIHNAQ